MMDSSVENKTTTVEGSQEMPRDARRFARLIKRLLDVFASFFGLLFLAPVFGLVAIAIKRDSKGPVYYKGERVGMGGKIFKIFKFRTMYETAESYNGPSITGNGDPRITPVGHWLRDTKLNELPQLLNVLRGEMSLVGPRPEDPKIVQTWPEDVKREVLSMRPGITSPASVIYRDEEKLLVSKNVLDDYMKHILPDKQRLDQLYVRYFSFVSDLDVLFVTLVALFPVLRKAKIDEGWLYTGLFKRTTNWLFSWFVIDVFVTTFMVGLSGLIWRISTVINLGVVTYLLLALVMAMLISIINWLLGLYRVRWATASPTYVLDIGLSIGLTIVILWAVNRYLITEPWIPFSLFWLIGVMTLIGLVAVRYRERLLTGLANRWLIARGVRVSIGERVLIVGAGELAEMTVWLMHRSALNDVFGIVGLVDDDLLKRGMRISGYPVIGAMKDIPNLVAKYDIGLVLFAISRIAPDRRKAIVELCEQTTARTLEIPDLVKLLDQSVRRQVPKKETTNDV